MTYCVFDPLLTMRLMTRAGQRESVDRCLTTSKASVCEHSVSTAFAVSRGWF